MAKFMIRAIKDTALGAERRSDRRLAIGNIPPHYPPIHGLLSLESPLQVTQRGRTNRLNQGRNVGRLIEEKEEAERMHRHGPLPLLPVSHVDSALRSRALTKKAAMDDGRIHAQAKATADRRPAVVKKTGRGLIHVPQPVMPYNDISNDHFLNKSPH